MKTKKDRDNRISSKDALRATINIFHMFQKGWEAKP